MHGAESGDRGLQVQLDQSLPIPLQVELYCPPGQVLSLVGPSGSGKSTVLRAIAGLLRTAKGRVACGGELWLDSAQGRRWTPQQRRVGMVFQQYALFPHLSALANVAEAVPRVHADRLDRAQALLARVNLRGLEARRPHELSGGQQQRVALARALAREPAVLLMDEPFSAVDEQTRMHLHAELAELRRHLDIPVVLVTHDLDEAALLSDRMAVLAEGRILQTGTPAEVLQRPASTRVAQLAGMSNVFNAVVERHDPGTATWLRWQGLLLQVPLAAEYAPGDQVAWAIRSDQIRLPTREGLLDRPGETSLDVKVLAVAALRQAVRVQLQTLGAQPGELVMQVPPAQAARHGIAPGKLMKVRLSSGGIVVMPPAPA